MKFILTAMVGMLAASAAPALALASPFCVQVTGIPLQCMYVDPIQCQQEADRQGGICSSNPREFVTPAGGLAYCTVESGNVPNCAYPDRGSCASEARRKSGACVAATPAKPPIADDPYEVKRPY